MMLVYMNSMRMVICIGLAVLAGCGAVDEVREEEGRLMNDRKAKTIRGAYGAGKWFPSSGDELASLIDGYLKDVEVPKIDGRIMAVMAPHAGYIYSGKVAAHAFRAVTDNARAVGGPDVVVVVGFCHSVRFPGVALMDGDMLSTPLGDVELDVEAGILLAGSSDSIAFDYRPHQGEHSAENEVPFVQVALPEAKIVVALMGDHESGTVDAFVSALGELSQKKKVLVVASTDMLHDASYELVTRTDKETLKTIESLEHDVLEREWGPSCQILCGIGPVLTAMKYAESKGCKRGTVLHYRNSGDDFPESRGSWVVGYGAMVFAAD